MVGGRLVAPTLIQHDPHAPRSVSEIPLDDAILEQLVKKILKVLGKAAPATPVSQTADTVETLPDRDEREAQAVVGDRVETGGNPGIRFRPHCSGDDIRVREQSERCGHSPPSPENNSGL